MSRERQLARRAAWAAGLGVLVLLVFLPAVGNDFVLWDDDANFLNNPGYRGLAWTNIRWMFTTTIMGHWIPLTWLTLGADYVLWGMHPAGYHLTSVIFHAVAAALFFLVARRLLLAALGGEDGDAVRLGAAAAALFWALHPLRAESVAWVTERRDVVSGTFYLLTVLAYLRAAQRQDGGRQLWLALSVSAFALALMSKSIVMTLPVTLIVLDVYPLRRLAGAPREWMGAAAMPVWLEKIPFAVLATAGGAIAIMAVTQGAALTSTADFPAAARPVVFLYDLAFYAWKTAVPSSLIAIYELPRSLGTMRVPLAIGAAAALAVTAALVRARRPWPAGLAAWTAFSAAALPAGGLIHNGAQLAADRYTYLPALALSLLVGGAVVKAAGRRLAGPLGPPQRALVLGMAGVWIAGLAALSIMQTTVWKDSQTLWRHALVFDARCATCEDRLGRVEANAGHIDAALEHLERAIELRPDRLGFHKDLVSVLFVSGRAAQAVEPLRRAIALNPEHQPLYTGLGVALGAAGRRHDAETVLRDALARKPDDAATMAALGLSSAEQGRTDEAIGWFRRALSLEPAAVEPRLGLVKTYAALGRREDAARELEALRRVAPALADELDTSAALTTKMPPTYN